MGSRSSTILGAAGRLLAGQNRARLKAVGVMAAVTAMMLVSTAPAAAQSHGATVSQLEVDGRSDDPLGVDDTAPSLSWRTKSGPDGWAQGAYEIRAARSDRQLAGGPYLWDSGKVLSGDQTNIPWGGPALRSRQTVAWRVRVWSTDGDVTPWSRPSPWEMGLLERSDWGAAKWIDYPGRAVSQPLPIFARGFTVDKGQREQVTSARLYLSGIGIHHAELNGKGVRCSRQATRTTSCPRNTARTT
jgi:alpha-L-rhamnosidase